MVNARRYVATILVLWASTSCGTDGSGGTAPAPTGADTAVVNDVPTVDAVTAEPWDETPAGGEGSGSDFGAPDQSIQLPVQWMSQQMDCPSLGKQSFTCGPVATAMAIAYVQKIPLTKALAEQVVLDAHGGPLPCGNATNLSDLAGALQKEGVPYSMHYFTAAALVAALKAGHPVIAPVLTETLTSDPTVTQINLKNGARHFMLIVGVTSTTIIVNDPGRSAGRQVVADKFPLPLDNFLAAWYRVGSWYGIEVGAIGKSAPLVITAAATSVSPTSAALNGVVTPGGQSTAASFEYGTTTSYGNGTPVQDVGSGTSAFNITASVASLSPATTYHYRVAATNLSGTTIGSDATFTTPAAGTAPSVSTSVPTGITTSDAVLRAAASPNGLATTVLFQYGTTTSYGISTSPQDIGRGTSVMDVLGSVTGLAVGTTYHVRAVATNSAGTTNGSDIAFTTASTSVVATPPVVGTTTVTSLATTATLSVPVTPGGSGTSGWFEWGTSTSYGNTTTGQPLGNGTTTTTLQTSLSGLASGTVFHVRGVAANAAGTVRGGDVTFTTASPLTAHFVMTAGTQSATDGGTLALTGVPVNGNITVTFDAATTAASGVPITSYIWKSNGTQIGTGSHISFAFGTSSNTITLAVTDQNGATNTATGLVALSFQQTQTPPTAHFTMNGNGQSASDGGTLSFTNVPVNGNIPVTFNAATTISGSSSITSYVWKSNGTQIGMGASMTFAFGTPSNMVTLTVTDANQLTSTAAGQVNLSFAQTTLPDLTASAQVASSYSSGQQGVQMSVTQTRSGGLLQNGTYVTARLYFSSTPTVTGSSVLLWQSNGSTPDFPISVMNNARTNSVVATMNIPYVPAGTYYVIVVANADNYYAESNTSNNAVAYPVTIH